MSIPSPNETDLHNLAIVNDNHNKCSLMLKIKTGTEKAEMQILGY